MVVTVTNITDGPGKTPIQIVIYTKTLNPGEWADIPAVLITPKVNALKDKGLISIGSVPSWYEKAKLHKNKNKKDLIVVENIEKDVVVSPQEVQSPIDASLLVKTVVERGKKKKDAEE